MKKIVITTTSGKEHVFSSKDDEVTVEVHSIIRNWIKNSNMFLQLEPFSESILSLDFSPGHIESIALVDEPKVTVI